jgi:hypothetical protein
MTEQHLENLMRGVGRESVARGLPVDFSGRVLSALRPQVAALWTPRFLVGLAMAVIGVATVAALWAGAQVEPEPPALTLYQGGGVTWWD